MLCLVLCLCGSERDAGSSLRAAIGTRTEPWFLAALQLLLTERRLTVTTVAGMSEYGHYLCQHFVLLYIASESCRMLPMI